MSRLPTRVIKHCQRAPQYWQETLLTSLNGRPQHICQVLAWGRGPSQRRPHELDRSQEQVGVVVNMSCLKGPVPNLYPVLASTPFSWHKSTSPGTVRPPQKATKHPKPTGASHHSKSLSLYSHSTPVRSRPFTLSLASHSTLCLASYQGRRLSLVSFSLNIA